MMVKWQASRQIFLDFIAWNVFVELPDGSIVKIGNRVINSKIDSYIETLMDVLKMKKFMEKIYDARWTTVDKAEITAVFEAMVDRW